MADHQAKLKESEKKDKYQDLARELKNLRKMKVTDIPTVISTLGTVTKGLVQGLGDLEITGRVETIQITALSRSARILRRVLETGWYSHPRIVTGTGEIRNKRTSGDHPNYSIIKISENTEESPENLRRLTVTQTSAVVKKSKRRNNNKS